jgi:hypothetical protein
MVKTFFDLKTFIRINMESATIKVQRVQIGDKWRIVVDPQTQALIIQFSADNFANVSEAARFPQQPVKDPNLAP